MKDTLLAVLFTIKLKYSAYVYVRFNCEKENERKKENTISCALLLKRNSCRRFLRRKYFYRLFHTHKSTVFTAKLYSALRSGSVSRKKKKRKEENTLSCDILLR
jgi:hypothetical protein